MRRVSNLLSSSELPQGARILWRHLLVPPRHPKVNISSISSVACWTARLYPGDPACVISRERVTYFTSVTWNISLRLSLSDVFQ